MPNKPRQQTLLFAAKFLEQSTLRSEFSGITFFRVLLIMKTVAKELK